VGWWRGKSGARGVKRPARRREFFALTRAFWRGYAGEVRFRPLTELQTRGIGHLAACALARIDGTSPVDYLLEEPQREAVRRLTRQVLHEHPAAWDDVLAIVEAEVLKLELP